MKSLCFLIIIFMGGYTHATVNKYSCAIFGYRERVPVVVDTVAQSLNFRGFMDFTFSHFDSNKMIFKLQGTFIDGMLEVDNTFIVETDLLFSSPALSKFDMHYVLSTATGIIPNESLIDSREGICFLSDTK